ncbi:MAG: hypothetical protein AB1489_16010 [Acidobacteriota bacterium]
MTKRFFLYLVMLLFLLSSLTNSSAHQATKTGDSSGAAKPQYAKTLQAIAEAIAELKDKFPQLEKFSPRENANPEHLVITYAYHTHEAERRGGWTSGVPNPDDDGIWFYIDFHAPDSQAQIHTQPVTTKICLEEKRVSFLILEGKKTKSLYGEIWSILKSHGAKVCK